MLSDPGIGKKFVKRVQIAFIMKTEVGKLDFIKIKKFVHQKTLKKVKMQATD